MSGLKYMHTGTHFTHTQRNIHEFTGLNALLQDDGNEGSDTNAGGDGDDGGDGGGVDIGADAGIAGAAGMMSKEALAMIEESRRWSLMVGVRVLSCAGAYVLNPTGISKLGVHKDIHSFVCACIDTHT